MAQSQAIQAWNPSAAAPAAERRSSWTPVTGYEEKPRAWQDPVLLRLNTLREDGGSNMADSTSILGKCRRNAVTGQVLLHDAAILSDFALVDLWQRNALYGQPEELAKDPYVFRITPLPYRTWMYHTFFGNSSEMASAEGCNGIMFKVLTAPALDRPYRFDGLWSPFLCYVPAAFVSCVAADFTTTIVAAIMCCIILTFSVLCNRPRFYTFVRLFTFLFRYGFLAFVAYRTTVISQESTNKLIGCVVILLCLLVDFLGDLQAVASARLLCRYKVIKECPNRIFVCRRFGGAFLTQDYAEVSPLVTGVGAWTDELALIAEVRGLIVQLKPMLLEDWEYVCRTKALNGEPMRYMGLDLFNKEHPDMDAVDLENAMNNHSMGSSLIDAVAQSKADAINAAHDGMAPSKSEQKTGKKALLE